MNRQMDSQLKYKFNSLVLIPSDQCNITCRHCAPQCGPKLKKVWDVSLLKQCISDAAKIENLHKSVHFAGGEPFLYFQQMLELCKHARTNGFVSSIVTNGFWSRNEGRAKAMFASLVEAGLYRIELSTDIFHQEHLPMPVIRKAIALLKSLGIPVTLRVITTRKYTVDYTIRQMTLEDLDGIEISGSPVVPLGRALAEVPAAEYYLSPNGAQGACHTLLNLTVRSDGSVFPCCAGSEENPSLSLGNIKNTPLDVVVRNAELNFMVKRLVHAGPASWFNILKEAGLEHKIKAEYTNICHACSQLFGDPEVVAVIRKHVLKEQQQVYAEAFRRCVA